MCLIVIAFRQHPRYPLLVAANRDEFFERPTERADFWEPDRQILAGRDLLAGGTWLGVRRDGRFAAVTNFRDARPEKPGAPSRGRLVSGFLSTEASAPQFLDALTARMDAYNGFNLVAGSPAALWYLSNRAGTVVELSAGFYGLSNHLLDSAWPKVETAKAACRTILEQSGQQLDIEALFTVMAASHSYPDEALPDTGVGLELERLLAPIFIKSGDYGTRSSTIWLVERDGRSLFAERRFDARARETGRTQFEFELSRPPA